MHQLFKLDETETRRQQMLKQSKERQRKVIESHVGVAPSAANNDNSVNAKEVSLLSSVAQKTMAAKHKKKIAQRRVTKKRIYA